MFDHTSKLIESLDRPVLQMKSPSPMIIRPGHVRKLKPSPSGHTEQSFTNKDHHNSHNFALRYIFSAARRVSGGFLSVFFRRRKSELKSGGDHHDRSNSRHNQLRHNSYPFDQPAARDRRKSSRNSRHHASPEVDAKHVGSKLAFEEICKATGNFSPANKIGEGGFGTVYQGTLRNGVTVAIKRAKTGPYDQRASAEFKNEILALSKIEHLSLVRYYGYIEHEDERLIVVEYVSNGTLRDHLDGTRSFGLEFGERLDIAIDVAHAITYLHTYSDPPIIHRDIKATNILITEKLRAKVADFGFARIAAEDPGATHISTQIKGTAGYLDPEYLRTYRLTEKSDVYSFGVLLVEMITGRHPIESRKSISERITSKWAIRKLKQGEVVVAMDPRLQRNLASIQAVEKVLKLARLCIAPSRLSRPSMKKCVEVLWVIRKEYREHVMVANAAASTSFHSAAEVIVRHASIA